jgi:hypothetical protein
MELSAVCGFRGFTQEYKAAMKDKLTVLKEARELVNKKYARGQLTDGAGGYDAVGALNTAAGPGSALRIIGPFLALADSASRLFGELEPTIVNDVLGKEATLKMFDDAILHEESGMAGVLCALPPRLPQRPPMAAKLPLPEHSPVTQI